MKKILIIEDDSFIQKMFKQKFSEYDIELLSAKTGEDGRIKALQNQPDMILLDLILPDMDGMKLLQELKSHPALTDTKIVIITNVGFRGKMEEIANMGIEDYFIKSNDSFFTITEMINTYLNE